MAKRERSNHIYDGYTEEGYVRAQKGVFDQDFWFLYRPLGVMEQQELAFAQAKLERKDDVRGSIRLQAKVALSRILEWDWKRADEKPVELKIENFLSLKPMLFKAVCSIVCGYEGSDELTQAHMQESNEDAMMQRILGGDAESKESIDAKNSEAG